MIRAWLAKRRAPEADARASVEMQWQHPDGTVLIETWTMPDQRIRRVRYHLTRLLGEPAGLSMYSTPKGGDPSAAADKGWT